MITDRLEWRYHWTGVDETAQGSQQGQGLEKPDLLHAAGLVAELVEPAVPLLVAEPEVPLVAVGEGAVHIGEGW